MTDSPKMQSPSQADASPFTILVVDDVKAVRRAITPFLEFEGYRVLEAEDGLEALTLIDDEPVDLILLDISMPGMDGFEVLTQLRRRFAPEVLPVIISTSESTESTDQLRGFDLGANDYVTKPIDMAVVLARILAQLRGRQPQRDSPILSRIISTIDDVEPGIVLEKKYRLDDLIDRGAYGAVYRATHLQLDRPVALKLLAASFNTGGTSLARFQQEGISTCRVQHPHAVSILDFSLTNGGLPFLVMELLRGRTLEDEMLQHGTLTPQRCGEIFLPVCEVLQEAHSVGIIHRDIKPKNIFLHRGRQSEVVKVLDFGIAKMVGEASAAQRLTNAGSVVGTPAYMAPERLKDHPYDGRSDVFSVGVLLFECLTGRRPIPTRQQGLGKLLRSEDWPVPPLLRSLRPDCSEAMEKLVAGTMVHDPEARPTAGQLAAQLAAALGLTDQRGQPETSPRESLSPPHGDEVPAVGVPAAGASTVGASTVEAPTVEASTVEAPTVTDTPRTHPFESE